MEQLKKCPFCGGEVKIRGGAEDWAPTFYDPDSGGDPYHISCECGLSFSIDSYEVEELVTAWNTRKPMERIVERLEELRMAEYDDSDEEPVYTDAEDIFDDGVSSGKFKAYHEAIKIVKEET